MIFAELRDAGTVPVLTPKAKPGMDSLAWREARVEEDWDGQHRAELNAAMRDREPLDVAPWPLKVPHHAAVDVTPRYEGLTFDLLQYVQYLDRFEAVPGGSAPFVEMPDPTSREQTNVSRLQRPDEVREAVENPTDYIRLPYENEIGGCELKEPAVIAWRGLRAPRFTVALRDNDHFTPVDLSKLDRYVFWDDEGKSVENGEVYAAFGDRARLVLYLRPRRWRYFAHCWAHYEYITMFEEIFSDEEFLELFWDRPPFYPIRQDVRHNAGQQDIWHEYEGGWLAYDAGIEWKYDHSRAAADMRAAIVAQEWYSLCVAYVLIGVEAAKITIWRVPPAFGEIVMGIGRVDQRTGVESRIWAVQAKDVSADYPQTLIGAFYAEFF